MTSASITAGRTYTKFGDAFDLYELPLTPKNDVETIAAYIVTRNSVFGVIRRSESFEIATNSKAFCDMYGKEGYMPEIFVSTCDATIVVGMPWQYSNRGYATSLVKEIRVAQVRNLSRSHLEPVHLG